jgi:hypothetical protein
VSRKDGTLGVICVREHLNAPCSNNNQPSFVCKEFRNRPLKSVDISLHYLSNRLKHDSALLAPAIENRSSQINSHTQHSHLHMLANLLPTLETRQGSETSWNISLDLAFDKLDPLDVDVSLPLLAEVPFDFDLINYLMDEDTLRSRFLRLLLALVQLLHV